MVIYTDAEITDFINERKILPHDYYSTLIVNRKTTGAFKRSELSVQGAQGNLFYIHTRQAVQNIRDFSVILSVENIITTGSFILRRYNGNSHWHSNPLEKEARFRAFHIHYATERYQSVNRKPEHYAQAASNFADIVSALECMITDCGFVEPQVNPERLI